eukprot:COSAG02_NODE_325_length_24616_cov_17.214667_15_plen_235_part_00
MTLDSTGVATSTNPFTLDISANELDLEGHELSSLDAQLVAKWLPKSSVTRINLCHNPAFSDPTQFVAMFQDSESKLRSLCGVKEGTLEIDWATHSISRADLIILSAELKLSRAASGIQSLDLSQTHLDEDGGAVLAEALASKQLNSDEYMSSKLQTLRIGGKAAVGVTVIFEGRIAHICAEKQDESRSGSSRTMKVMFADDGTRCAQLTSITLEVASIDLLCQYVGVAVCRCGQ